MNNDIVSKCCLCGGLSSGTYRVWFSIRTDICDICCEELYNDERYDDE